MQFLGNVEPCPGEGEIIPGCVWGSNISIVGVSQKITGLFFWHFDVLYFVRSRCLATDSTRSCLTGWQLSKLCVTFVLISLFYLRFGLTGKGFLLL